MPKTIVSFSLSDEVIEALDKTSKALGISRSQFIELIIEKALSSSEAIDLTVDKIAKLQEALRKHLKEE
jgi:predicted DNA-binding protein